MMPRTLICLTLLFVVATTGFAQTDSLYMQQWNRDALSDFKHTNSAQRQVITKETIRNSGYTRLSDVLQLIDGWTLSSLVETGSALQSNGTGSYNQQNWVLMLNGQRIELDRSFPENLDQLAIAVYDIERIEVINTNGMFLGEFTQYGLIQIITKKQTTNGINANAYYAAAVGYGVNNGYWESETNAGVMRAVSLGYTKNNFHVNTSVLFPKNSSTTSDDPYSTRTELQYTGKKISHQFQSQSLYPNKNIPYQMASYLGLWDINPSNQIRFSTTFNKNNFGTDQHAIQSKNTLQHRYFKRYKKGNFIWQTGLGFDYIKSDYTGTPSSEVDAVIYRPYTSINIPITRKANLFADAQAAFAHDKIAPKVSLGIYKRISFISNYSFVVGYTESLLEENFLTTINKEIIAINGASYFHNPKLATADLYYNINIGNNVKFTFNSGLKNAYDLPGYSYHLIPISPTNNYVMESIKRATYELNWINRFNFHYDIIKNLVFDINYMHTSQLNTWYEGQRNIPKHKFSFTAQYEFPKRFTVWSRFNLQSETQWFNVDGQYWTANGTELFYDKPTQFSWDLGLNQKLFKEFVNLNLSVRNAFNKFINYSPADQMQLRGAVFLGIGFNINGIGEPKTPKPETNN